MIEVLQVFWLISLRRYGHADLTASRQFTIVEVGGVRALRGVQLVIWFIVSLGDC